MDTVNHNNKNLIQSKNVRKFASRSEVYEYLSNKVFENEDFIRHVSDTAQANNVSYILAFDVISNHLTDLLYEVDKNIAKPKRKVKIRCYGYFSLQVSFMISGTKKKLTDLLKRKKLSK